MISKKQTSDVKPHNDIPKIIMGFFLMIVLTSLSFYAATKPSLAGTPLWIILFTLALIQVLLQFYTFMHMGERGALFYNIFMYTGIVISVISGGGLLAP